MTIEPTLRRDRGLCHEKMGSPFPAAEDYRAYLVARPDAPDADLIRDRLFRLEESAGIGRPSAQSVKDREDTSGAAGGASFSLGTAGPSSGGPSGGAATPRRRRDEPLGPKPGEKARSYDYYAAQERLADAAESSPLRYGTGWALGPLIQLPRFFITDGETSDAGGGIGATVRYSWSPSMTFLMEAAYVTFGTAGEVSRVGGPLFFAGVEYRIPLDVWATNQLFLGIGPGFERYQFGLSKIALNILNARGRFGFRHVFGPSFGLEIAVDGGPGIAFQSGQVANQSSDDTRVVTVISGTAAFVIGF